MFRFRFILDGPALEPGDIDALLTGGCDDAVFGCEQGVQVADFARHGASLEGAVLSALRDVERGVAGLVVTRVEPDDLVTATEIARRTGRTRQSIAQLIAGKRRSGGFPPPLSTSDGRSRIWRWTDVRDWFDEVFGRGNADAAREGHFLAALNGALDTRRHLAAYRRSNGTPSTAFLIRRLAAGTDDTVLAEIMPPQRSATRDFRLTSKDIGVVVESATLRTRSHIALLAISVLESLSGVLTSSDQDLAAWVSDAARAHNAAVRFRLSGDLDTALWYDRHVMGSSVQICRHLVNSGLPRNGPEDFVLRFGVRDEDLGLKLSRLHDGRNYFAHHGQRLNASTSEPDIFAVCGDFLLSAWSKPMVQSDFPRSLIAVSKTWDWLPPNPVDADNGLSTLRDACLVDGGVLQSDLIDHVNGYGDVEPIFGFLMWSEDLRRDSLRCSYVSSLTFAQTLRALIQQHLPNELDTIDEAVRRLETDLAEWYSHEQ